ncbi:mediator of RNA polymerase II transcription subunit 7-like [Planococcus citri]|uniref:mediator of RNA polymerase II transcription subunit 7-like n=1 Tax=Planococcus citri TaxID=170843 RepID=UPI0031F8F708
MATGQEQVSSLPLPPVQYITLFSDENIRRGRAPKPPPLIQDTYSMFGRTFNADDPIIRPLESQGIKRLYPQHFDRRRELKKLNHSLLVNFLDLLDILVYAPESPRRTEKVDDISILFIHIHHLLNEFRPHQARETLRVMLDLQKRQRIETAVRFRKHLDKANEILQHALENLPDSEVDSRILATTDIMDESDAEKPEEVDKYDSCTPEDRLMCQILDSMELNRKRKRKPKSQSIRHDKGKGRTHFGFEKISSHSGRVLAHV